MGRLFYLAAALAAAGCGKVAASPADAAIDALPDALTCSGTELVCGTSCTNALTDGMNCGSCGNICDATRETCNAGHCIDSSVSCTTLMQAGKPSGIYTLVDATIVYCDMEDGGVAYSDLAMDNVTAIEGAPYVMVGLADLQAPSTEAAFIALYNQQGGNIHVLNLPMDGIGNCAIKISTTALKTLGLMGSQVAPATVGGAGPEVCSPSYTTASLSFVILTGSHFAPTPLPPDYFTTNPASEVAGNDGANPAFFWRKVVP